MQSLQLLHINTRWRSFPLNAAVFRGPSDDADQDQRSAGSSGQVTGVSTHHKHSIYHDWSLYLPEHDYWRLHLLVHLLLTLLMVWFLSLRIRSKIVDPYNKIVARITQLDRLQVTTDNSQPLCSQTPFLCVPLGSIFLPLFLAVDLWTLVCVCVCGGGPQL